MAATSPTPRTTAPVAGMVVVSRQVALIAGAVLAAVFIAVYWSFFYKQLRFAYTQPSDWGHTLVIPAIAGYFVWLVRDKLTAEPFVPSMSGVVLVLLGMGVYMAAAFGPSVMRHHNLAGMGVGLSALGVLATLLGWRSLKYLWFPWAYWLVFGQTVSERALQMVTERMQDWSAVGAHLMLNLTGIETDRLGNVLTIHRSDGTTCPLNVAEACSGMRMLVAFMALGVAMAYTGLPLWWQRVLLVVAGVPISLFVNMLRVASLGVLGIWDANFTAGQFHAMVGLVWLIPAFLLFLGAMWVIRNLVQDVAPTAKEKSA